MFFFLSSAAFSSQGKFEYFRDSLKFFPFVINLNPLELSDSSMKSVFIWNCAFIIF